LRDRHKGYSRKGTPRMYMMRINLSSSNCKDLYYNG
jgi:hypothetical protein